MIKTICNLGRINQQFDKCTILKKWVVTECYQKFSFRAANPNACSSLHLWLCSQWIMSSFQCKHQTEPNLQVNVIIAHRREQTQVE